jgi:hypothetical protein|tara:strand:- start:26879 stop:28540 length:1662 start_codon:yes stop_codon:yes gene_type:complete
MSIKQKKSQLAVFLILGVVMVIMIVSLFLISRYSAKRTSKQEIIDIKEASFDTQPIKNFITECLSLTSKDSLKLLGEQAGFLYTSQGGTLIDYPDSDEGLFFARYKNSKVAYNIHKPRFPFGKYSPNIPNYPWKTFPYDDDTKTIQTFTSKDVFGTNNMPPVNKSFGPNSFQEQLISFMENNIDSCLNFEVFEEQGFNISKKENNADVAINEEDVSFKMQYNAIVHNLISGEKTELRDGFFVKHSVRLGKVHEFVNQLIEFDISNIKFNIINSSNNEFEIDIKRDVFENDDLIIVTDTKSNLDNLPYKYFFARKNRNPALFYLTPIEIELPAFYDISEEDIVNRKSLEALDPDEDPINNNSFSITPKLPVTLAFPNIEFKVEVNDSSLKDYQVINVKRVDADLSQLICTEEKALLFNQSAISKALELNIAIPAAPKFLGCNQKNPDNDGKQDRLPFDLSDYDGVIFYNARNTNTNYIIKPPSNPFLLYAEDGAGSFFDLNLLGSNPDLAVYIDLGNSIITVDARQGTKYKFKSCSEYTLNSISGTCPDSGVVS